ncbi:MAG: hypothetical protein WCI26_10115 [Acidimicrobiales bacterium]
MGVVIAVDKNSTAVFPSPLMSTNSELGSSLAREVAASDEGVTAPEYVKNGRHPEESRDLVR